MLISKTIEIDMGHRVPNHKSKCRNIHGHRYKIEVGVDDKVITEEGVSSEGMVIDFSDLKEVMMSEIDARFDHGFMMSEKDDFVNVFRDLKNKDQNIVFVNFIPTAENISKYFFELLVNPLKKHQINLEYVKLWETPNSTAIFTRQNYYKDN